MPVLIALLFLLAVAPAAHAKGIASPPRATIVQAPCPHEYEFKVNGCAYDDGTVYVGSNPEQSTVEHELGHAFDTQLLNEGDRRYFARLLGFAPHVPWDVDLVWSPREQFADAYMACRLHMSPDVLDVVWMMMSRYSPSTKRHRRVCAALERVSAR